MIECYHVRRIKLVVENDYEQKFYDGPIISPLIATIDSDKEELEDIWDCCNNSCWWHHGDFRRMRNYKNKFKVKFTNNYSGYCNDDLIVKMSGHYYVAKHSGWKSTSSFSAALSYCKQNSRWCKLNYSTDWRHPDGYTKEELLDIKSYYESNGYKCEIIRDIQ